MDRMKTDLKKIKHISPAEMWEMKQVRRRRESLTLWVLLVTGQFILRKLLLQMLAANCIDKSELPDFDDEMGLLPKEDSDEEDVEVEVVEEKPAFLHGHGSNWRELSPVSKAKLCERF